MAKKKKPKTITATTTKKKPKKRKRTPRKPEKTLAELEVERSTGELQRVAFSGRPLAAPTDLLIATMRNLITAGNYPDVAARACGISATMFRSWCEQGLQRPHSVFGKFLRTLDQADAQGEVRDIQMIGLAVKEWDALRWIRSRRSPARWGDRSNVSLSVPVFESTCKDDDEAPIKALENDEAATILNLLEQAGALGKVIDVKVAEPESV